MRFFCSSPAVARLWLPSKVNIHPLFISLHVIMCALACVLRSRTRHLPCFGGRNLKNIQPSSGDDSFFSDQYRRCYFQQFIPFTTTHRGTAAKAKTLFTRRWRLYRVLFSRVYAVMSHWFWDGYPQKRNHSLFPRPAVMSYCVGGKSLQSSDLVFSSFSKHTHTVW